MGSKLKPNGVQFPDGTLQTKSVKTVNSISPNDQGVINVPTPTNLISRVETLEQNPQTFRIGSIIDAHPTSGTQWNNFAGISATQGKADGYHAGSDYAIFYYSGGYTITLITREPDQIIPVRFTILSGGGGGAGGYQGGGYPWGSNTGLHADELSNNSEDGFAAADAGFSRVNHFKNGGTFGLNNENEAGTINYSPESPNHPNFQMYSGVGDDFVEFRVFGWEPSDRLGSPYQQPAYNNNDEVHQYRQLPTVYEAHMKTGVQYKVYVGMGGDGGDGAGGNTDWNYTAGAGGAGGAGGTRGAGTQGSPGSVDPGTVDRDGGSGGSGGLPGGSSGAEYQLLSTLNNKPETSDIQIELTKNLKLLEGFGQTGAHGAKGHTGALNKWCGGGGGGGGGSNGLVLIEWGDYSE